MFQQTFEGSVGRPIAVRQKKKFIPTNLRVKMMVEHIFFFNLFAIVYVNNYRLTYDCYS